MTVKHQDMCPRGVRRFLLSLCALTRDEASCVLFERIHLTSTRVRVALADLTPFGRDDQYPAVYPQQLQWALDYSVGRLQVGNNLYNQIQRHVNSLHVTCVQPR